MLDYWKVISAGAYWQDSTAQILAVRIASSLPCDLAISQVAFGNPVDWY